MGMAMTSLGSDGVGKVRCEVSVWHLLLLVVLNQVEVR